MTDSTKRDETPSEDRCPRPYRLGQRQKGMEETRERILDAARKLILGEDALAGFTMEAVARQAGVTRMTVYHRFKTKRGLLEALFDEMGARGKLGERLPGVFSLPNPLAALRAYVETFCDFWATDRTLNRRLRGFAALDEEFAAALASRNERRRFALETLLRRLSESGTSIATTDHEERMKTLLALTGFEFYDVVAGDRSPQHVATLVFDLILVVLAK